MSVIQAILIAAGTFAAVTISLVIALFFVGRRQMKRADESRAAWSNVRERLGEEASGAKSARLRAEEMREHALQHYQRVDALQERSERNQERWERVIGRFEALADKLEDFTRR